MLASVTFPMVADSVISGSDYDNDGQLSLDEMFYDKNLEDADLLVEKFSFDIATGILAKLFGSLGGLVSKLAF